MKIFIAIPLALLLLCGATACGDGPATSVVESLPALQPDEKPAETPDSSLVIVDRQVPVPEGGPDLPTASPVEQEQFLHLYENGYIPLMEYYWGGMIDGGTATEINGETAYRLKDFATMAEMEAAFKVCFTDAFVQRNITGRLNSDEYMHFLEQDGILYTTDAGGIGGTYQLYTPVVWVEALAEDSMEFSLWGRDARTDLPDKDWLWRFTASLVGDEWKIDTIVVETSDDSGWSY